MAEYRIILNIGGSAVRQAERLADALQRADRHAKSLSQDLRSVPKVSVPRVGGANGTIGTSSTASFLSGGLTSMNIAGLIGKIAVKGLETYVKTRLQVSKIGYSAGYMVTNKLVDVLMGQDMDAAIRYVQRRNQLRASLGGAAPQALEYANTLAESYGFSRATTLGSLNVLTGLSVGKSNKKIDPETAASIVQVGGLIAQQGGYSYERVMTNFQQLFANSVPSKRDIREMLGQAPILARYATEAIAEKGLTGKMDMYDYYKSHENIANALARYAFENPVAPAALARGRIKTAREDVFNQLAENPSWGMVATNYIAIVKAFGNAINGVVTSLANNDALRNSVNGLVLLIETLGKNADWIINVTTKLGEALEKYMGIRLEGGNRELVTQKQNTIRQFFDENKDTFYSLWLGNAPYTSKKKDAKEREEENKARFEDWFVSQRARQMTYGSKLYNLVGTPEWGQFTQQLFMKSSPLSDTEYEYYSLSKIDKERLKLIKTGSKDVSLALGQKGEVLRAGTGGYVVGAPYNLSQSEMQGLSKNAPKSWAYTTLDAYEAFSTIQKEMRAVPEMQNLFGDSASGEADDGSKFGGFNRDRRSLEIHFHAPIVEWNSEINTDNPKEVVDAVANNIEGAASRAIQIALLGASQKMSTRWY